MGKQTFLAKSEPDEYAYSDLERDGQTSWSGVRNAEARKHLRSMCLGDRVLFYHSGKSPEIVGIAEVIRAAYPEPGAVDWVAVDVKPLRRLRRAVTLAELRREESIANWALIRRSRLSVMPVSPEELACVRRLERTALGSRHIRDT
jgi:predicted RNA-binding protein with PUA-like domain